MEYRQFGRTGLKVSALGFGCGAVGGLLIKGDRKEMVRVVARAVEVGITYFDTARSYGDGTSEANLGRVLEELKPTVLVGTKVQLLAQDMQDIEQAIVASVDGSLKRLRRDREVSTVLVGISDMEQLEQAVEYVAKGALPADALERLNQIWASYMA